MIATPAPEISTSSYSVSAGIGNRGSHVFAMQEQDGEVFGAGISNGGGGGAFGPEIRLVFGNERHHADVSLTSFDSSKLQEAWQPGALNRMTANVMATAYELTGMLGFEARGVAAGDDGRSAPNPEENEQEPQDKKREELLSKIQNTLDRNQALPADLSPSDQALVQKMSEQIKDSHPNLTQSEQQRAVALGYFLSKQYEAHPERVPGMQLAGPMVALPLATIALRSAAAYISGVIVKDAVLGSLGESDAREFEGYATTIHTQGPNVLSTPIHERGVQILSTPAHKSRVQIESYPSEDGSGFKLPGYTIPNHVRTELEGFAIHHGYDSIILYKQMPDGVDKVGKSYPYNGKFAGEKYPLHEMSPDLATKYPDGIAVDAKGFMRFEPYVYRDEVVGEYRAVSEALTGNRDKDNNIANGALGITELPKGYTWHHVEDGRTMIAVPTDLHKISHTGGAAIIKHGLRK